MQTRHLLLFIVAAILAASATGSEIKSSQQSKLPRQTSLRAYALTRSEDSTNRSIATTDQHDERGFFKRFRLMIKQAKIKAAEKQRASDLQRFQDWYEKEKFGPEKVKEILYYYENLLIAERKGKMKQLQKWRWHKMSLDYEDYYWKRERGITPAN